MMLNGMWRIRFSVDKEQFSGEIYVLEEDYPKLYHLIRSVAKDFKIDDCELRLALLPNTDVGILKWGNVISVQFGVILLDLLSEEEIKHILLHEFAHLSADKKSINIEYTYRNWLNNGGNPTYFSWITSVAYEILDSVYLYRNFVFDFANTLRIEAEADEAMKMYNTPEYAASALLKIKFYSLYEWELDSYDDISKYVEEEPSKHVLTHLTDKYKSVFNERVNDWVELSKKEIQSRSDTHPVLNKRLERLGVSDYKVFDNTKYAELQKECDKAFAYVEELIYEIEKEDYDKRRQEYYAKPKELVDNWMSEGQPIISDRYTDIIVALMTLQRKTEAEAVCDNAISQLPDSSLASAHYYKGILLLSRFDAEGINHIYKAIENSNYIEDGLNMIGAFCCITGRQKELEEYRNKASELIHEVNDKFSHIGTLSKSDNLTKECLPEDIEKSILELVESIDNDYIFKIYVVRKSITDDFFTSAIIVNFYPHVESDTVDEIMHRIFCLLDSIKGWQFSLFDYREVKQVGIEKIEGCCIYSKTFDK